MAGTPAASRGGGVTKLAIKASVKHWERYWEVIDISWANQLHRHLHAAGNTNNFLIQLLLSYLKAKYYKLIIFFTSVSIFFKSNASIFKAILPPSGS